MDLLSAASGSFRGSALLVALALLVLNGFFVAVEIALLATRRSRIEAAAEAGDRRARRATKALAEVPITFSGAQLGITMCSLGLGVVAEPALAAPLARSLGATAVPSGAVPALAVVLALTIILFLHMAIGELAPRNLAIAHAERLALALVRPFGWFVALLRPLVAALNAAAASLVRAVGVEPVDQHALVHTPDELALALAESQARGTISPQDARVLDAALHLGSIDAEAAMTPRVDLDALPDTARVSELLDLAAETGHTRIPVYHDGIDNVVGIVHVKDVLISEEAWAGDTSLEALMRPIAAVPVSRDLERLLRAMLDERSHAVLVVDEFGGTAGLLTLEDVLEELVGDIADEFDVEEEEARQAAERDWVVPGTLRRDEVARLTGLELPEGETETVSGWIVERLGRLPEEGDRIDTEDGWVVAVRRLEGRRAGEVEIRAPEASRATGGHGDAG